MRQTIIATVIASMVGAASGYVTARHNNAFLVGHSISQMRGPVTLTSGDVSVSKKKHASAAAWGELEQSEVDALTAALEKIEKKPVTIFCSDAHCDDIALDFDNAFESAHWKSGVERPFINAAEGVWSSSKDVAAAIEAATGGRLKVSILGPEWRDGSRIAVAFGRKPR